MVEETYSAGLISQSFWFVEMKKVIKLIDDGKSEEEIKKMCIDENLFGAAKEYRAKRIYGYIWNRAKRLDKTLIDLFCTSDLATQKVISLIVNHIRDNTPEKAVVFITGIGKCYPILRSHTVLNNLHQVIDNVPVVLFYPGNYDGQELVLFGEIKDDNYYRAFKLVD